MSSYTSTILITGGTSGLGYPAALSLARSQPNTLILIASRSDHDSAAATINKATGHSNCAYAPLDLGTLASVRSFVGSYSTKGYPPLTALLLNAGLQFAGTPTYNADGIEKTFAVNHVGHALLFYLLIPYLAANARIVITASGTHDPAQKTGMPNAVYTSAGELAKPSGTNALKDGRQQYTNSKLANMLWGYALDRRVKRAGKSWTVTLFDPGLMPGTGLARDAGPVVRFVWLSVLPRLIWLLRIVAIKNTHTPKESGQALARLAVAEDVKGVSGKYFEGLREIRSSRDSYLVEKQEDLWKWTLETVAKDDGEKIKLGELS
jgi:NAD(P)-dependent dehydrogenase (short-subunit alcohol dehydrogenase family)